MKQRLLAIFLLLFFVTCFFASFSGSSDDQPHAYHIQYASMFGEAQIPVNNPLTEEGVWLGRLLFYDPIISVNNKISCGSCHQQKLYFTDGLALAIGVHGETLKRNTMSLVNLAWDKNFFWDGRDTSIEEVVADHINNVKEMGGVNEKELVSRLKSHQHYPELFKKAFPNEDISEATVSKAIAQFTRTIVSDFKETEEKFKQRPGGMNNADLQSEESQQGSMARLALMQCKSCHGKPVGEQLAVYDDNVVYKAPTLVNIKYTGPYMHDGRFKTLKEVFQFYTVNLSNIKGKNPHLIQATGIPSVFTAYDLNHADDLFRADEDLTISTNLAFSNPFIQKGFKWK
jgi:cytochrome c peroxidase